VRKVNKKLAYYPGCSLEGTAREYGDSFQAVCSALGIELEELVDWNCCGASSAHCTNRFLAGALPARNLRLAQDMDRDIVAPCVACWGHLRASRQTIAGESALGERIARETGVDPHNLPDVVSALDAILEFVRADGLRQATKRSFNGLPVVTYYGCLSVRPVEVSDHPRPEDPQELDELMAALGADVRPWSYKTDCCGGYLTLARSDVVSTLVDQLLQEASLAGASAIVTSCPMCAANLEMRRTAAAPSIPVIYFTEAIGYALDLVETRSWLRRHLVTPTVLLKGVPEDAAVGAAEVTE